MTGILRSLHIWVCGAWVILCLLPAPLPAASESRLRPIDLAVLADGRLLLLDEDRGPVLIDPRRPEERRQIFRETGFEPFGLEIREDEKGVRVYVASIRTLEAGHFYRFSVHALDGTFLQAWKFFSQRRFITVTEDFGRNRLLLVDSIGSAVYALKLSRKSATPDLVSHVFGAKRLSAVLPMADRLIVTDPARGRVLSIQEGGGVEALADESGMPVDLVSAGSGEILILDGLDGRLLRLKAGRLGIFGELSTWQQPVAFDIGVDGRVWVADPRAQSLSRFGPSGELEVTLDLSQR